MKVEWRPQARHDASNIVSYIAARNPVAAEKIRSEIERTAMSLAVLPRRGRPGKVKRLRELSMPNRPYFFVYEVGRTSVTIHRLVHSSRNWPDI